ncbi:uncharacterized protein LOC141910200 [Tubulanus polymorphus]|uniref:uncharacterized protein LOC141910200 n=1 Tax=Tubulanus polymorphus TaxID=672921 RepID=UPI003DA5C9D6
MASRKSLCAICGLVVLGYLALDAWALESCETKCNGPSGPDASCVSLCEIADETCRGDDGFCKQSCTGLTEDECVELCRFYADQECSADNDKPECICRTMREENGGDCSG